MHRFYILIIFIIIVFSSCSSTHFQDEVRFDNNNWTKFNELEFNIPVEADKTYSFSGHIITESTFNRRKIELGFYMVLPSGAERLSDLNFRILNFEYQPLGEKTEIGFQKEVLFKKDLLVNDDGILNLKIVLHSQYYDNFGIVGLDLFVNEK